MSTWEWGKFFDTIAGIPLHIKEVAKILSPQALAASRINAEVRHSAVLESLEARTMNMIVSWPEFMSGLSIVFIEKPGLVSSVALFVRLEKTRSSRMKINWKHMQKIYQAMNQGRFQPSLYSVEWQLSNAHEISKDDKKSFGSTRWKNQAPAVTVVVRDHQEPCQVQQDKQEQVGFCELSKVSVGCFGVTVTKLINELSTGVVDYPNYRFKE